MKKTICLVCLPVLFAVVTAAICIRAWQSASSQTAAPSPVVTEVLPAQAAADRVTDFGSKLYRHVATGDRNVCFSPYSISVALTMTYAGARGRTAEQMAHVLGFPDIEGEALHAGMSALIEEIRLDAAWQDITLTDVNSLWHQDTYPVLPEYLSLVSDKYGAQITSVDFIRAPEAARASINSWVTDATDRQITNVLPPGSVTTDTRLALVNALWFKAPWAKEFDPKSTRRDIPFHLLSGGFKPVPTMFQTERFGYRECETFRALDMPYQGREFAMTILLPTATDGIAQVEELIRTKGVRALITGLKVVEVSVSLPKFRGRSWLKLPSVLHTMGMRDAFVSPTPQGGSGADFSGIDGERWLYVHSIQHETMVEVDEKGTEAAAVTAVTMMEFEAGGPERRPVIFRVDHPFIYFISHVPTGTVLFLGKVTDPTA